LVWQPLMFHVVSHLTRRIGFHDRPTGPHLRLSSQETNLRFDRLSVERSPSAEPAAPKNTRPLRTRHVRCDTRAGPAKLGLGAKPRTLPRTPSVVSCLRSHMTEVLRKPTDRKPSSMNLMTTATAHPVYSSSSPADPKIRAGRARRPRFSEPKPKVVVSRGTSERRLQPTSLFFKGQMEDVRPSTPRATPRAGPHRQVERYSLRGARTPPRRERLDVTCGPCRQLPGRSQPAATCPTEAGPPSDPPTRFFMSRLVDDSTSFCSGSPCHSTVSRCLEPIVDIRRCATLVQHELPSNRDPVSRRLCSFETTALSQPQPRCPPRSRSLEAISEAEAPKYSTDSSSTALIATSVEIERPPLLFYVTGNPSSGASSGGESRPRLTHPPEQSPGE